MQTSEVKKQQDNQPKNPKRSKKTQTNQPTASIQTSAVKAAWLWEAGRTFIAPETTTLDNWDSNSNSWFSDNSFVTCVVASVLVRSFGGSQNSVLSEPVHLDSSVNIRIIMKSALCHYFSSLCYMFKNSHSQWWNIRNGNQVQLCCWCSCICKRFIALKWLLQLAQTKVFITRTLSASLVHMLIFWQMHHAKFWFTSLYKSGGKR